MIIAGVEFKEKPRFEWELLPTYPWKVAKKDRTQLFAIDYLVEEFKNISSLLLFVDMSSIMSLMTLI